jgi:hypothetical protein
MWRRLPTPLGVGYQICDGVCQALLANSATYLITNTKRCWQTPPHIS